MTSSGDDEEAEEEEEEKEKEDELENTTSIGARMWSWCSGTSKNAYGGVLYKKV